MTLSDQIKALPLADIIEATGTKLRKIGKCYVGLCTLHPDKNPSLVVFEDNHFKCFACGKYGDPVDYVRYRYGFDFKQALEYLSITTGPMTNELRHKIESAKFKRILKERREQRIRDLIQTIGLLIRTTRAAMARLTMENLNDFVLGPIEWWEYCYDTLVYGDDDEKTAALAGLKDFNTICRNHLFKPGFDYRHWFRGFTNGTYTNA
jgi:DNA primase